MRALVRFLIRAYQLTVSPLLGPCCRFYPSCSSYALEAFAVHGFARACALTLYRLARCQPLCAGGYDPVPSPRASGPRTHRSGRPARAAACRHRHPGAEHGRDPRGAELFDPTTSRC